MAHESLSTTWSSDKLPPGCHTFVTEPVAEQAVYLVLVSISLISHEMIHHGNNDKLLGWKHSQSKAKQNVKLLQPQCPRLPSYLAGGHVAPFPWNDSESHHLRGYFPPYGRGIKGALPQIFSEHLLSKAYGIHDG